MEVVRRSSVCVVDDDVSVRESLHGWLKSLGFVSHTFDSAESLLESSRLPATDCLILDVRLAGMSGLELQRELRARGEVIPIIFITAHGNATLHDQAVREGALAVLDKPFAEAAMLNAIRAAVNRG